MAFSTAADVMATEVVSIGPDESVRNIADLLLKRGISSVPVVDADGRVIGIVSEGDLIGHAAIVGERRRSWWLGLFSDEGETARDYVKSHARSARDVMTPDVVCVAETATVAEIAEAMQRRRIKSIPVVRDERLVGIVSRGDLLRAIATPKPPMAAATSDEAIRDQLVSLLRDQPWAHLLDVRVENGVVHLHGTFQSEDERRALRVAAENVAGVKGVEDHLTEWNSDPISLSGQG